VFVTVGVVEGVPTNSEARLGYRIPTSVEVRMPLHRTFAPAGVYGDVVAERANGPG
jgi:hypothetical protein